MPVKAAELEHHLAAMALLAGRVDALTSSHQDPAAAFRLEAAAVPPAPKWGKPLGWSPRDDAALLLGVYYHGLGRWEVVAADARLGLGSKLAGLRQAAHAAAGRDGPGGGGDKAQQQQQLKGADAQGRDAARR